MIIGNPAATHLLPPQTHPRNRSPNFKILAKKLDGLFAHYPALQQQRMTELAHWLLCCKNLWPAPATKRRLDHIPFSLRESSQTLQPCRLALATSIANIIDPPDGAVRLSFLLTECIALSDETDWHALQELGHIGMHIDPVAPPGEWPHACLLMALQTFDLDNADLQQANFRGAVLNDMQLRNVNLRDADFRNANLERVRFDGCDLRFTDFRACDLDQVDFARCDLHYAGFEDALLTDVTFSNHTNAQFSIFNDAELQRVSFENSDLSNTEFRDSCLKGVCFYRCGLQESVFEETTLNEIIVAESNCSRVKIGNIYASDVGLYNVYIRGISSDIPTPPDSCDDIICNMRFDTVPVDDAGQSSTCTESETETDLPLMPGSGDAHSRKSARDEKDARPSAWIRAQAIALSILTLSQPTAYIYRQ